MGAGQNDFNLTAQNEMLPNQYHSDKFTCIFSNFPGQKDFKDFRYFQNYIKTITLPELNMNMILSQFQGAIIRHPDAPVINQNYAALLVNFRVSEDFKNYVLWTDLMRQIRYGCLENETPEDLIRKYVINSIDINLLDNHKRCIAKISYLNCFPTMISSLNLEFGSSDEIIATMTFSYSEFTYKTYSIEGQINVIEIKTLVDHKIISETLSRIGIMCCSSRTLYPSAYLVHLTESFYIAHFKELFSFINQDAYENTTMEDEHRLFSICFLLQQWKLIECLDPIIPHNISIDVLRFEEKKDWQIKHKIKLKNLLGIM